MACPRARAVLVSSRSSLCAAAAVVTAACALFVAPAEAAADQPVRYVERPITLPALTLSPELALALTRSPSITPFGIGAGGQLEFLTETPVAFGITDDIQVDMTPLSVRWSPSVAWGMFAAGFTGRFVRGPFELAGRFQFGISGEGNLMWNPGLVARIHAGNLARIDIGALVTFLWNLDAEEGAVGIFQPFPSQPTVRPGVPVELTFNLVDEVFAGLTTGFGMLSFENAEDNIFVPLGFFGGATVAPDGQPLLDAKGSVTFPRFISRDGTKYTPIADYWQLGADVRFYFAL